MRQPFALAVEGIWPDDSSPSMKLPLDNPSAVAAVSRYLNKKGLKVETPQLTQAYQVDLDGDGKMDFVVCAHSDSKAVKEDESAAIYAVSLVFWGTEGKQKITKLAAQYSCKPARRSIEEHERLYGTRDFYRIIAIHDIDGDGRQEVALYRAKDDATQIDIFTFKGHHRHKVLSAYKANYN